MAKGKRRRHDTSSPQCGCLGCRRARKQRAMNAPGFKSRYAKRKEARANGAPMAARSGVSLWVGELPRH